MNIKSQKGFTGADITVAILIITIFAGIIASLYSNYQMTSTQIARKSEATDQAIEIIENIKSNSQRYFTGENETKNTITVYDNDSKGAYTRSAIIEHDKTRNSSAEAGIVKIVRVRVSYKFRNEIQSVELSTVISKEGNG